MIDLVGNKFGQLVVIECVGVNKSRQRLWLCECSCGKFTKVQTSSLNYGNTKSCGCKRGWLGLPPGEAELNTIINIYKQNAKKRGIAFELSKESILNYIKARCHYCGRSPSNLLKAYKGEFTYQGIDRVNNKLPYNTYNCVPCCEICNKAKRNLTEEEFLSWIEDMIIYRKEKLHGN